MNASDRLPAESSIRSNRSWRFRAVSDASPQSSRIMRRALRRISRSFGRLPSSLAISNSSIKRLNEPKDDTYTVDFFGFEQFFVKLTQFGRLFHRSCVHAGDAVAETTVYCRERHTWTDAFVARNRNFRVDSSVQEIPSGNGVLLLHSQRIVPFQQPQPDSVRASGR